MQFLKRERELDLFEDWWSSPPASKPAFLWGRRRVPRTALLAAFADGKRTVFHTGDGRPVEDGLRILSCLAAGVIEPGFRDLGARDRRRRGAAARDYRRVPRPDRCLPGIEHAGGRSCGFSSLYVRLATQPVAVLRSSEPMLGSLNSVRSDT